MITNTQSGTTIDEVAPSTYRISTPLDIPGIPGGFTVNQYLVIDDEPLLFHTGMRRLFPLVSEAISKVLPLDKLRHISFSHFEADESGALNEFLAVAPNAAPLTSELAGMLSVNDFSDRPGRLLADGEEVQIGSRTLQWISTPHLPHGWDAGVIFDKTHGTLFSGDLFAQPGSKHAAVTKGDILGPSETLRQAMGYFANSRGTGALLEKLADLNPKVLGLMHGSAYQGDGASVLRSLACVLAKEGVA